PACPIQERSEKTIHRPPEHVLLSLTKQKDQIRGGYYSAQVMLEAKSMANKRRIVAHDTPLHWVYSASLSTHVTTESHLLIAFRGCSSVEANRVPGAPEYD